jgi:hypothetical protein
MKPLLDARVVLGWNFRNFGRSRKLFKWRLDKYLGKIQIPRPSSEPTRPQMELAGLGGCPMFKWYLDEDRILLFRCQYYYQIII